MPCAESSPQKVGSDKAARKRLAATGRRRKGVYNRACESSVAFCGTGGAVNQVTDFLLLGYKPNNKKSERVTLVPTWCAMRDSNPV